MASTQTTQPEPPSPESIFVPKRGPSKRSAYFRNIYAARRRGPSLRQVLLFIAVVIVLLAADGLYVAIKIQAPLRESARLLDVGAEELQEGNVAIARESFAGSAESAAEAAELASRPSLFVASYIPFTSSDPDVIRALARSAELVSAAGVAGADAVQALGGTTREEIAEAIYSDGRLAFDRIEQAQAGFEIVSASLREASELLEDAPLPILDRLSAALVAARDRVIEVEPRATSAARLLETIPQMMGRDEPRRYFVALQGQSEARATGGVIGLYGVMEADRGRIRLPDVGPSFELGVNPQRPLLNGIVLPAWYADRYGDETGFGAINRSPNFPLVARTLLQMYENSTGTALDGVWSFDPSAFQNITRATGPLRGVGFDVDIGPDNAVEVLSKDAYLHFGEDRAAQTAFLLSIIQDLYGKLGRGESDTATLLDGLASSAQGGHFKVYSTVPSEQSVLESLGVDGGLENDGTPRQMVFHNNIARNKIDYFLRRTIRTEIDLTNEGGARVTTTAILSNEAPSGPPSVVLGYPQLGQPPGSNEMELNFVLPQAATDIEGAIDGTAVRPSLGREGPLPVAAVQLGIPPKTAREVSVSYSLDRVQRFIRGGRTLEFVLTPQPVAVPDRYIVRVEAPDGFVLTRGSQPNERPSSTLRFKGDLSVPVTISARMSMR